MCNEEMLGWRNENDTECVRKHHSILKSIWKSIGLFICCGITCLGHMNDGHLRKTDIRHQKWLNKYMLLSFLEYTMLLLKMLIYENNSGKDHIFYPLPLMKIWEKVSKMFCHYWQKEKSFQCWYKQLQLQLRENIWH